MKRTILSFCTLLMMFVYTAQAQQRVMNIHLNNGITHQYIFTDVDSVSFVELAEVLPPVEEGRQMMSPEMQNGDSCAKYYSLTDHYIVAQDKAITEYVFGSSVAGQYALMPLEKEKMVMLYGGGKYEVTKYGSNHAEALYDENLTPVCSFSTKRGNVTYEKSVMSYIIDLTDKEGVYYLRRFTKLSYANRSSVVALEDFTPKGRTGDIEIHGANISRFNKDDGKGYAIPVTKNFARISFDFTINKDANIDAEPLEIASFDMVGNDRSVKLLRRAPEPMKVRYYGDKESVEKADAQELAFKSGFIIGVDTIVRSLDFYKPLTGEPFIMLWLKGEEYDEEPTKEILAARENELAEYVNYSISLQGNELALYDNEAKVAQVVVDENMTVGELCKAVMDNPAFDDFMVYPLLDVNAPINSIMQFPKIKLVGNYYQSFNITSSIQINSFEYHLDSYPVVLREAIDNTKHTFDAVCTDEGVFVGIDGNFCLLDYDIIRNIYINENINATNIDVLDGKTGYLLKRFTGKTRMSEPYLETPRSPFLLGLMGHHVETDSPEGSVPAPNSDVSSGRLANMCSIMKEEEYKTLNMDELVEYMDGGMKAGKYAFFMFDDFRMEALYLAESTRNIFINNGIKSNLALIHYYLWDTSSKKDRLKYISPMKELGWNCVSHSLRHNMPTAKKPSIYLNYELQRARKECEVWGMNSEVFVYNWDGTWEPSDILFLKNGYKYAVNSRGTKTTKSTNPYRLGRTSFQEALPFSTIEKVLRWH